jgi:hypothetical protein
VSQLSVLFEKSTTLEKKVPLGGGALSLVKVVEEKRRPGVFIEKIHR